MSTLKPLQSSHPSSEVCILNIDGVQYTFTKKLVKKKKKGPPSFDQVAVQKLAYNYEKQEEEIHVLKIKYKQNFLIIDQVQRKYAILFDIRGCPYFEFQFSLPALYPSEVPANYFFDAPWLSSTKEKELKTLLFDVYKERFGQSVVFYWADQITEFLKEYGKHNGTKGVAEIEEHEGDSQNPSPTPPPAMEKTEDFCPPITEGTVIQDRGSYFAPYLAEVRSEKDVKLVIDKIESRRKVASAFRNTYAYRFKDSSGKVHEFEEDGGEPKAGRNLLQRLVNYNANDVIVFISRRIGGSLLGPDRYKHLNAAADDVLISCGFKNININDSSAKSNKNKKKNRYKEPEIDSQNVETIPGKKNNNNNNKKQKNKKYKAK